ncbi:MAG: hypothetical protein ABF636_01145 [Acetobacter sp.]
MSKRSTPARLKTGYATGMEQSVTKLPAWPDRSRCQTTPQQTAASA